jgi:hypothetical protein
MSKSAGVPLALTDADVARWRRRIGATSSCAVWLGAVGGDGYGPFTVHRAGTERTVTPHQVAAVLAFSPLPIGSTVLHDCDVRLCCATTPGHVRVSTQAENMSQAARRGRANGPRPGRVDVRGPAAASRAVQQALRDSADQSPTGLSRALAAALAAGDPLRTNLTLFGVG